ncbi:MAG TPA: tetratricopeptide repeat protein [Thermoanaerobaculia bacterium]|nr:tetratricopeptide repeat protein [Thermoanaerobaculia bacterium]
MHVPPNLLDAVARGELPRELLVEIVREHLAAICPVCGEELLAHEAGLGRAGGRSPAGDGDPIERLRRRLGLREGQLRLHEEKARRWVRELVRLAPEKRRGRVRGAYSRFRGPLFGALLLEEARRKIPADPAEALSLAEAALLSCEKSGLYQADPEIQAPALAVRGNARRALGRLREAEEDLSEARRLLDSPGVTDPATPGELYSYLGSLRRDQGRLEEAADCLERAARVYELLRNRERAARVLLKLGAVHYLAREFDAAVAATEEALGLLDAGSEAWLRAYAHFNLAHHLHASGETDRAEAELAVHAELLEGAGAQVDQHVVWLRARIAWSRGNLRAAERLFTEARAQALACGGALDMSLVTLELALVHLAQGRTARVKKLAAEALAVFTEQEVEREIRAALALVEAAAGREALTRELVERAIASLESARHARPGGG